MKYAVEMDSDTMIYVPNLKKNGSGIQKLMGGDSRTQRHTDSMVIS
jgi:hypothetical protein